MKLTESLFITGMSCRLPGAGSVAALERLLFDEVDAVTVVPQDRWAHDFFLHPVPGTKGKSYTFAAGILDDLWQFDAEAFGISPREAGQMDPQQRLLLQVAWEALEDAGLPPDSLAGTNVGVYVGCSAMAHAARLAYDAALTDAYLMTGNTLALVSNRISHVLDLRGPSMTVDTACSSSILALKLAAEALQRGDIDTAIVAGANALLDPIHYVGFSAARMLSPTGRCKPFSATADGYVRAEGAVAFVLERRTARSLRPRRAHAVLRAVETNTDGRTVNVALPSLEGQSALLRKIYTESGISPDDLAFVEAHGTGTQAGDPVEATALGRVLGQARTKPLPIGSVKSNIGHLEPASGVAGLAKAVIALKRGVYPATLHLSEPNPSIPFDALNLSLAAKAVPLSGGGRPLIAGLSSFGFGGANAHAIIEAVPETVPDNVAAPRSGSPVLLVTAASEAALRKGMAAWQQVVQGAEAGEVAELCAEAAAFRGRLPFRAAVVCDSPSAAAAALAAGSLGASDSRLVSVRSRLRDADAVFVFSGNGSQYAGMGLAALERDGPYARRLAQIDRAYRKIAGWSIIEAMRDPGLEERLRDCAVAQPLLFADQMALVAALEARGLRPAAVMGHSGGEVAAACTSGALDLQSALQIVLRRSEALQRLRGQGTMAAVQASAEDVRAAIRDFGPGVEIAAENSPKSVSVVGEVGRLDAFLKHARKERRWAAVRLAIDYPYHGSAVDAVMDDLRVSLNGLEPVASEIPFVSSVSGQVMEGTALDADYWCRNARRPVEFREAMHSLREMGFQAFVEIGASPVLQNYMTACLDGGEFAVLQTLDKSAGRGEFGNPVDQVVAGAVAAGLRLAGGRVLPRPKRMRDDLPTYRWNNVDVRIDQTAGISNRLGLDRDRHPFLGREEGLAASIWYSDLDAHQRPLLADHKVGGRVVVPGALLAEIALAAGRSTTKAQRLLLSDMDILSPVVLGRQHLTEVQTRFVADQGRVTVSCRTRGDEGPYRLHAQARVTVLGDGGPVPGAAPDPVELAGDKTGDRLYVAARRLGLEYGPAFARVARARNISADEVEVFLRPGEPVGGRENPFLMDVTGADAAFHGLLAILEDTETARKGHAFVPVRIGRLHLLRSAVTVFSARVRMIRRGQRTLLADFTLYGQDGEAVVVMEAVRFSAARLVRDVSFGQHAFRQIARPLAAVKTLPLPDLLHAVRSDGRFAPDDDSAFLVEAAAQGIAAKALRAVADGSGQIAAIDAGRSPWMRAVVGMAERTGHVVPTASGWALTASGMTEGPDAILDVLRSTSPGLGAETAILTHLAATITDLARSESFDLPGAEAHFGRSALDNLTEGSVFRHRRRQALVSAIVDMVQKVDPGTVVRIAEITDGSAHVLPLLVPLLTPQRVTLTELVVPPASVDGPASLPPDRVQRFGLGAAGQTGDCKLDLLVSEGSVSFGGISDSYLSEAIRCLAEGGRILFAEPAPSDMADLVHGLDPDWFTGPDTDNPMPKVNSARSWTSRIAGLGLADVAVQALPEGLGHGFTVTGARRPAPDVIPPDAAKPPLAAEIAALLGAGSEADILCEGQQERLVALFPVEQPCDDPVGQMARRILAVRDLVARAAEAEARLVLLIPGGSGLGTSVVDPGQAGLWTFVRSVVNENPLLQIARYDIDGGVPAEMAAVRIADLENAGSSEREVLIGPSGPMVLRVGLGAGGGHLIDPEKQKAVLRAPLSGGLDDLGWQLEDRRPPGPGEVEIAVEATGLNYRDVMWSMGLLPEEALEKGFAGPTIGIECAGRVTHCGEGVSGLAVGDAVLTFGPACFSTHIVVKADLAAPLPPQLSTEAAATVPVAFFTAWYALVTLANMRPGESILIHGGAGGVGLAAIQIARHLGLRIFATAGSGVKRSYLRSLGVDHVLDSRSLRFADEVKALTGGRGVDAVLNGLAGQAMERSVACLAPFGRFLELGKQDFYANTALGLRLLKENIAYHGIDVDQIMSAKPELAAAIFRDVMAGFAQGVFTPLPYRSYEGEEAVSAFRLMQKSGHLGKIVIRPPRPELRHPSDAPLGRFHADPDRTHVVIGGLGGLGLEIAEWLVDAGARRIALLGRRVEPGDQAAAAIARWTSRGVDIRLVACDVADEVALGSALDSLRPLAGVIHSAMVLEDMLLSDLTPEVLARVLPAKIAGAVGLDRLTREDRLDYFVLFSSLASLIGNHGQSAYVAANGFMEGIARSRRKQGLPALAVGWGAISDVGYLVRDRETAALVRRMSGNVEFTGVQVTWALERLLALGAEADPVVHVTPMGWQTVSTTLRTLAEPAFALMKVLGRKAEGDGAEDDLRKALEGATAERAEARLTAWLTGRIAHILQVPEKAIATNRPVSELGIDSLMGVELGLTLQESLGDDIPVTAVSDALNIRQIAERIVRHLHGGGEGAKAAAEVDALRLASQHLSVARDAAE